MIGSRTPDRAFRFPLALQNASTRVFLVVAMVLVGFIYLIQASQAAVTGQHVIDQQQKLDRINQENAQLAYEIAALLAPDKIESRARKLGLRPATANQIKFITVKDYPVEPSPTAEPATTSSALPPAGSSDWTAWLQDLLDRVGLAGAHPAEVTNP